LGGKSGVLNLTSHDEQAQICFYQGRIINATGPKTKNIGELLTGSGAISASQLKESLEIQKRETPKAPLGKILVRMKAVTTEHLHRLVGAQIEQTIYELVTWTRGSFQFALDDVQPIDDLALNAAEIVPLLQLNTQMLL